MSDNTGQGLTLAWGYTISSSDDKVNPNASTEEGSNGHSSGTAAQSNVT